jgi:hypothetical protein
VLTNIPNPYRNIEIHEKGHIVDIWLTHSPFNPQKVDDLFELIIYSYDNDIVLYLELYHKQVSIGEDIKIKI